ncbi:ubiquitin specific peptidase echinus [Brevipalpus obovatus]|uniref:ubiquitin specific peptidase echinus n=1 Tax=Brevipalpus obovatus TaxID=246614 RepID=UPI003D9EC45B
MSMAQAKGLLNMPGQNNCFLNSAVQVLWHLDIFRRSFRDLSGHACMGSESCIFCALKELFTQFQYSHETALPPDSLRKALAETFSDQRRFQLGFMDDAAECFENILLRIHGHIAHTEAEDACSAPHCISHEKFAMNLVEQIICSSCGATSEPLPFTQMVHYVSSPALCLQAKKYSNLRVTFGQLLRCGEAYGNIRDCPSGCGAKIQIRKTLINRPDIVSIGLVWDSERPALNLITDVFRLIGTSLNLDDVFDRFGPTRSRPEDQPAPSASQSEMMISNNSVTSSQATLQLVGLVTYYGKHYSTFFYHTKLCSWIYFDDAAVREIGPHWEQVVDRCIKGHFQPLLLLYANPNGTAINASTAPQQVTMVSHPNHANGNSKSPHHHHHIRHSYHHPHHLQHHPHLQTSANYNSNNIYQNIINLIPPKETTSPPSSSASASATHHPGRMLPPASVPPMRSEKINKPAPLNINSSSNMNTQQREQSHQYQNAGQIARQQIYGTMRLPKRTTSLGNHIYANGNIHQKPSSVDDLFNQYASTSDDAPDSPMMRSSVSSCYFSDAGDADSGYMSRKTIENILAGNQKITKQGMPNGIKASKGQQRSSISSIDSYHELPPRRNYEDNHILLQAKACSLQRRDSGNSSNGSNGDWFSNSSNSSSGSRDENPYVGAPQARRSYQKSLNGGNTTNQAQRNQVHNQQQQQQQTSLNDRRQQNGLSTLDQGYDSFSLSSSDSYPSIGQTTPTKQSQLNGQGGRLSQIPEDVFELINGNNSMQDCVKLCAESEFLLMKSMKKEGEGDIVAAAALSDSAAHKARAAMAAPYSNTEMLVQAQMKHSICVMRSASLHKKLKEIEAEEKRRLRMEAAESSGHSRQNSRDSGHGRHSRQNSKDGSTVLKETAKKESKKCTMPDYVNGKTIQLYGTLPKKLSSGPTGKKKMPTPTIPTLAGNGNSHTMSVPVVKEDVPNGKRSSMPSILSEAFRGIRSKSSSVERSSSLDIKSDVDSICSSRSTLSIHKARMSMRMQSALNVRDSDLSDNYYSEWEAIRETSRTKKESLKRSSSGLSASSGGNKSSDTCADSCDTTSPSSSTSKKPHKIRRKLLIGNFMKRKNRSLPDLRENCPPNSATTTTTNGVTCANQNGVEGGRRVDGKTAATDDSMTPKTVAKISRKGFHQGMGIYQRPALLKVDLPLLDASKIDKLSKSLPNGSTNVPSTVTTGKGPSQCQSSSSSTTTATANTLAHQLLSSQQPLPQSGTTVSPVAPPLPPPKIQNSIPPSSEPSPVAASCIRSSLRQSRPVPVTATIESEYGGFRNMVPRAPTPPKPRVEESTFPHHEIVTTVVSAKSTLKRPQAQQQQQQQQQLQQTFKNGLNSSPVIMSHTPTPPPPTESICKPGSPSQGIEPNDELPPPPESFLQELREKRNEMNHHSLLGRLTSERLAYPVEQCDEVDSVGQQKVKNMVNHPSVMSADSVPIEQANKQPPTTQFDKFPMPVENTNCTPSVKDLASRFQKMVSIETSDRPTHHHSQNSSDQVFPRHDRTSSSSLNQQQQSSSTMGPAHQMITSSAQKSNIPPISSPSPSPSPSSSSLRQGLRVVALLGSSARNAANESQLSTSSEVNQSKSSNPIVAPTSNSIGTPSNGPGRPGRPPDYETALKRLCQQKVGLNNSHQFTSSSPIMNGTSRIVSPSELSKQLPSTIDEQKDPNHHQEELVRRRDPNKKSVSFSDQVELVAPAEDEEEEYLPNPLLERVLGKRPI